MPTRSRYRVVNKKGRTKNATVVFDESILFLDRFRFDPTTRISAERSKRASLTGPFAGLDTEQPRALVISPTFV